MNKMPGGVAFSGGECLLQMSELEPLLERLQSESIHTTVETSLFVPKSQLDTAIRYIDLFYVDIKILDEEKCRMELRGNLEVYYNNLQTLLKSGKPIVFRVPVIGGYTDDDNRAKVIDLLKNAEGNIHKIELIKEHNLGISKYQSLIDGENDIKIPNYMGVSDELMEEYKREIESAVSIPVEVCKI